MAFSRTGAGLCILHQLTLMAFHRNLRDSKSPQVSRTLLRIWADLNNAIVWMDSTLISKSSSPFINLLVTVPRAPITIGIIVTFIFHSFFFRFPRKIQVLILLFTFFQLYFVISWDSKFYNFANSPFLFVDYYKVWSTARN